MTPKAQIPTSVKRTLLAQVGATVLVSLGLALHGRVAAYSALTGGMVCVIANSYAAWRVFSSPENETASAALSNLYRAEAGKLLMMSALFIAVFAGWRNVDIGAFVGGCGAAMIVGLIGAAFQRTGGNILNKGGTGTTDG